MPEWRNGRTRRRWLLLVVGALTCACSSEPTAAGANEPEHPAPPSPLTPFHADGMRLPPEIQDIFAPDLEVEGIWQMIASPDVVKTMEIRAGEERRLELVFYIQNVRGLLRVERGARCSNVAIVSEQPLPWLSSDRGDAVYAMHPCRVEGVDCLVPVGFLAEGKRARRPYDRVFWRLSAGEANAFTEEWRQAWEREQARNRTKVLEPR